MTTAADSKERFSNRVADYVRYRPGYPPEILELLHEECGLTLESVIADVGSGTGILTKLFLENGNSVYGVEPNEAMREAGEEFLAAYPKFRSVAASAEATTMPDACVDFVIAAQAFHWFDPAAARKEALRILRPPSMAALIWNDRRRTGSDFARGYEALLLRHSADYGWVSREHARIDRVAEFFGHDRWATLSTPHGDELDFAMLSDRLNSASYVPAAGDPGYGAMMRGLQELFAQTERGGKVTMEFDTRVLYASLQADRGAASGQP